MNDEEKTSSHENAIIRNDDDDSRELLKLSERFFFNYKADTELSAGSRSAPGEASPKFYPSYTPRVAYLRSVTREESR